MENFGGALGVFIIIVVTLAQLAGKNKRAGKKPPKQSSQSQIDRVDTVQSAGGKSTGTWGKRAKAKSGKIDSAEKISAENTAPSFEVDANHQDNVEGFDVK